MPFISRHILIDLPFYKPSRSNKYHWPDQSGQQMGAIANEKCDKAHHDRIGACLRIKSGGELTFPGSNQASLAQFWQNTQQLTIEFWAQTDNEVLKGDFRQIFRGPISVWLNQGKLHWSILTVPSPRVYALESKVGENLQHWAIAVNHQTDGFGIQVFQDGLLANYTVLDTPLPNELVSTAQDLAIGAASNGWTGKLAHLRIWATALSIEQIRANRSRDITAHAAFKVSTGIEWRLLNANDEPSLYIHSSRGQQVLSLEVANIIEGTTLVVPQQADAATESSALSPNAETLARSRYHFQLVFRRGTIATKTLDNLNADGGLNAWQQANPGWRIDLSERREEDIISFLREGDALELAAGEKLSLRLPGVAAEPGAGSRTSIVMLRYRDLKLQAPDGQTLPDLDGHRAQVLNILYRDPTAIFQKPPLEVGIVGSPVILNNGKSTTLTLYIKNINRNEDQQADILPLGLVNSKFDETPKFVLEMDLTRKVSKNGGLLELGGLGDNDDLEETEVIENSQSVRVESMSESGGRKRWSIILERSVLTDNQQKIGLQPNEIIFITIRNLKTTAPAGPSLLRLVYQDFEDYGEGVFEIPIEKVAAVPVRIAGSGKSKGYGLALGHDPRVGKALGTAAMAEMLSVKQTGDGDAVKIENVGGVGLAINNTGSGTGLEVLQKDKGFAAKFQGGSGVEIDGNLQVKNPGTGAGVDVQQNGDGLGLNIVQNGSGLAAKFSGGSGVEIDGELQVNQRIRDKTGEIMPVGAVLPFAGKMAPEGWELCDGRQVNGEKYQDLAKVLFGAVRNSFDLPNYQARFFVGATGSGDYELGQFGGQAEVRLTVNQMPRHNHEITDPGHRHQYQYTNNGTEHKYRGGGSGTLHDNFIANGQTAKGGQTGISINNAGDSQPHENRPPFVALNYIIKY